MTDLLEHDGAIASSSGNPSTKQQPQNSTQDLLLELFGGESLSNPLATSTQPAQKKADDILSLFDSSTPSASAPTTSTNLLASQMLPHQQAHNSALPENPVSYNAYERHGLAISLTPQTSASHPGLVNIQVRFQVTQGVPAIGVNFQAAVPKVKF